MPYKFQYEQIKLKPDDDRRVETLQTDAKAVVLNSKQHNQFDAVQVDLYDAICDGPAASSLEFYN